MILRRVAPRASRTAISLSRAAARAMRRLATLAQAMSRTPPVRPMSRSRGVSSWRLRYDRPWPPGRTSSTLRRKASRASTEAFRKAASLTSISSTLLKNGCRDAFAWARVTPGFSRPKALTNRDRRSLSASQRGVIWAFIIMGTKTWGTNSS
jgi:hypothetical protein